MKRIYHFIWMSITLLMAIGCGWLIPHVRVNSDMTKYLPNESQMKQGIEIITNDFDASQLSNSTVKVMCANLSDEERTTMANQLALRDEVNGVTYSVSTDSVYTKYDLLVSPDIDQKAFGAAIRNQYGDDIVVETLQDGATPPLSALIIAGAIILIILIIMSHSWLEPVVYLLAIGVAVVLNIGTNAFLPSVSITTNYIVAILQLVLSLDYAIILSNRYRQELLANTTLVDAVNRAIRLALPSVLSSALTTVVGLLMLAFMRVKIGLDLGLVLAKGVVCSLFTTFALLPSLLILFHQVIEKTRKRVFVIPTDRLGWFATHHKTSLAIASVTLFGIAFYYSRQTNIYFNTNGESTIEQIFPKANTIVALYPTNEEEKAFQLADSLLQDSTVKAVISYPTLLKRQYTADQIVDYIHKMSTDMADYMPAIDVAMLTPDVMRTVYYMHSHAADTLHITFPTLMQFVQEECINNPMFEQVISDDMRAQMDLLEMMMHPSEEGTKESAVSSPTPTKAEIPHETEKPNATAIAPATKPSNLTAHKTANESQTENKIRLIPFMQRLYAHYGDEYTYYLLTLTDTTQLRAKKTVRQMADYIGSTVGQTKIVYSFSDKGKRMTALEYVHFLTDDLFQRKALAKLVNQEQKDGLILRTQLMDAADKDWTMPADELTNLLTQLGVEGLSVDKTYAIAGIKRATVEDRIATNTTPTLNQPVAEEKPQPEVIKVATPPKKHVPSKEERQAKRFDQLMYGGKAYTAKEMTKHFQYLGQQIDPVTVNMLYCYYGSFYAYNTSLSMSPEQLLAYVADTLVKMDIVVSLLDSATLQIVDSTQAQLSQAVSMLSHDQYSLMLIMSDYPTESASTYHFVDQVTHWTQSIFQSPCYLIGESVMFSELKEGFSREMTLITLLTILAIFTIVAITFRSIIVPSILVMTVMTAVYVNVIVSGWVSGQMLYLAYLIVQSILMGATIDYGILFASYYVENRRTMEKYDAARAAYHGSIPTIMTSGLIMVLGPGVMALLVDDVTISAIVGCISVGAFVAILLILAVLPGVLVACDKWVVSKKIWQRKQKKAAN